MTQNDDDTFEPKLGRLRQPNTVRKPSFRTRLLRELDGDVRNIGRSRKSRGAKLGRGHVEARFAGRLLPPNARRVVIKTRLVNLKKASPRSLAKHLCYIEREGVGRQREPGHAYGPIDDRADLGDFQQRCSGDRHQFRFIVAPEDGTAIHDLRCFTRDLMARVERDLGTSLDWVAVDHWDTDNPHTHIVLRGKDHRGQGLVIAREYISRGMRQRACELATDWLGPCTELEIQTSQLREIEQERWTNLDRSLQKLSTDDQLDLSDPSSELSPHQHRMLRGRLQHLVTLGLAGKSGTHSWDLHPEFETTLRAMGERCDIVRTMQRAMGNRPLEFEIFDPTREDAPVIGRIVAAGLLDELSERGYLIVDALDGRTHYVALEKNTDLERLPKNGIVELRGNNRTLDRAIGGAAIDGVYDPGRAAELARTQGKRNIEAHLSAQNRRLEVLRWGQVVERTPEGLWIVPTNILERGQTLDTKRLGGAQVKLHSALSLEQQISAIGATWLDRQLASKTIVPSQGGFSEKVRDALDKRIEVLIELGLAQRRNQRLVLSRNLLATLEARDIENAAKAIQTELGIPHRPTSDGTRVSGVYRRPIDLASGRYAMIDDGLGFSLVPWRPVAEKRLGQSVSVLVSGAATSWNIGRKRDLQIT